VLIDEAAQAAEVAALQPLVYGARKVVLVGDPQQLPATIFSSGAREVEMERSLFQRLSLAGCPVGAGQLVWLQLTSLCSDGVLCNFVEPSHQFASLRSLLLPFVTR
jgi:hypothetical protein